MKRKNDPEIKQHTAEPLKTGRAKKREIEPEVISMLSGSSPKVSVKHYLIKGHKGINNK